MGTPTRIPTTTRSTAMNTAVLMGGNTITSIMMSTNTALNHIITGMSTPAAKQRLMTIHNKQLISSARGVPTGGYAPVFYRLALEVA